MFFRFFKKFTFSIFFICIISLIVLNNLFNISDSQIEKTLVSVNNISYPAKPDNFLTGSIFSWEIVLLFNKIVSENIALKINPVI